MNIYRINRDSDSNRIAQNGKVEDLGPLPATYDEFLRVTGVIRQRDLNQWFMAIREPNTFPFFTPKYTSHSPTFCIAESMESAQLKADRINSENEERERIAAGRRDKIRQEQISEMRQPAKGWYVVTLNVLVSKIRGNDGIKTYSFKVLADSQMDAYEKARNIVLTDGVKDRNVSFVYDVADSATSALIEYIGVWSDESELEFGPAK